VITLHLGLPVALESSQNLFRLRTAQQRNGHGSFLAWSLLLTLPQAALRAKIVRDETEDEGFGGPKVEDDNEVSRDLRRNP
jgi:hypothetical protein